MPLTIDEIVTDGAAVGVFVAQVKAFAASLPPAGEAVPIALYTDGISVLIKALGPLVDQIREDIAD